MLKDATTLHPRLQTPEVLAELRARWADGRRLRIDDALAPGLAEALSDAAFAGPFTFFEKHVNEVRCVLWRQVRALPHAAPTGDANDPLALARRLFTVDLPALASAITDQALVGVGAGEHVVFDVYRKGSYLDVHTDQGADRLVAYVVGLTRDSWPVDAGGHLEFLGADHAEVVDRVAPGFGSIDLFTIFPLLRPHRIPILREDVVRLSVNGWLTGALAAPGEAG